MKLYELCGADRSISFSPYVWRIKMALAHKGIDYEPVPLGFTEKEHFAESGYNTYPTLDHDGHWVSDSWNIACYLEEQFADRPSLFGGPQAQATARFVATWVDGALLPPLFRAVVADIPHVLSEADAVYFHESRERVLGCPLDDLLPQREQNLAAFQKALGPAERTLSGQSFIAGDAPNYADYALFGAFQWARAVSPVDVLAVPEGGRPKVALTAWRERMLDLYAGLALRVPACASAAAQ